MRVIRNLIVVLLLFSSFQSFCQGINVGIRAGLNYNRFLGPSEQNSESYSLTGGFHFGVGVGYSFNEYLSIKSEIQYVQNGSNQLYEGDGFYLYSILGDNSVVPVLDSTRIELEISNAYISFPLTVNIRTLDKWEFFAGGYINILISPIATGKRNFGRQDTSVSKFYRFEQGLDYDYFDDRFGESNPFANQIRVQVNGQESQVPSLVGGYYLYSGGPREGSRFTSIDYGLLGGINYYLNPGLYLGLRVEYGLRDITTNSLDASNYNLNTDTSLIFRDDYDRNFGFQISLGFKF